MSNKALLLAVLIACAWMPARVHPVVDTAVTPHRTTILISDLHFGVGRVADTESPWHSMEDFRWGDEFINFLRFLSLEGRGNTDLVLNGDTFELWQSLKDDCQYASAELGCTETEAVARIKRIIGQHGAELLALSEFARFGDNHLYIVPGNHDAALLFEAVREEVNNVINVPGKTHIEKNGYWRSVDGRILAEHGHQIGKDVNSWKDWWPRPFLEHHGTKYLKRPWGEKFVQDYYNRFEKKYPIIDNISEEGAGIFYARKAEGAVSTIRDVAEFFNFLLFKVSREQFVDSLGQQNGAGPGWDLATIRAKGPEFLVDALPANHPFTQEAETAAKLDTADVYFRSLSDDDINFICVELAKRITDGRCPQIVGNQGAVGQAVARNLFGDTVLAEHLDKICANLVGCYERPFNIFVYSHTHLAADNVTPIKNREWRPRVFNTGAWQRTVTPTQLKILASGLKEEEVLSYITPEDLPKCYGVIVIGALKSIDHGNSGARLKYWTASNGMWSLEDTCNEDDLAVTAREIKKRLAAAQKK